MGLLLVYGPGSADVDTWGGTKSGLDIFYRLINCSGILSDKKYQLTDIYYP